MNWFLLREYWHYRRVAQTRHGVHSPFVYQFIDKALRPAPTYIKRDLKFWSAENEAWQMDLLLQRIAGYFLFSGVLVFHENTAPALFKSPADSAEILLHDWRALNAAAWLDTLKKQAASFGNADAVLVDNVHQSKERKQMWEELCAQPEVRLSIDLFRIGLLFFSKDFKERQHFVLRYPL